MCLPFQPHAPLPVPMGEHAEMIRVYVPADGLEIFVKHVSMHTHVDCVCSDIMLLRATKLRDSFNPQLNANWDVRMAVHVRPQTHANVLLVGVEITVIRVSYRVLYFILGCEYSNKPHCSPAFQLCVHLNAKMGATALVPIHVNADLAGREITVNYVSQNSHITHIYTHTHTYTHIPGGPGLYSCISPLQL